ncbi:hypothetical protein ACFV2Q_27665 [Streptomyces sp. NPDC059650]|uniref:hypothetical protein n=1 Tax=Streptomyces sp. NPDC059650 TaxID=3346896 RepID=UPI003689F4A2
MKGKEAARMAQRRLREAEEHVTALQAELKALQTRLHDETRQLRAENASLALDIEKQAGRLAAQTVADLREQLAAATGSLRGMEEAQAQQRDTLIRNTCRALSMQHGQPPVQVLGRVIPWITGEGISGVRDVDALIDRVGVPVKGWTAGILRSNRQVLRFADAPAPDNRHGPIRTTTPIGTGRRTPLCPRHTLRPW